MKSYSIVCLFFIFVIIAGCNNDSIVGSESGGAWGGTGGGGGGGTGGVSFTVSLIQDQQSGETYFQLVPSTDAWVTSIQVVSQAAQVNETFQVNNAYSGNNPLYVGPVPDTMLQQGQQWQFTIQGNIGNQQGESFNVTANFTV